MRVYEFTTKGVPSAAIEWIHVWWAGEAFSDHQQMLVTQVGWPLPTLQAEELFEEMPFRREASQSPPIAELSPSTFPGFPAQLDRYGAVWNLTLPGAPPARTAHDPSPIIPIRPLALGFIANSALFATGVAVVLLIPGALRTLIRRRRNACLACGYRLDQLSRCPECGVSAGGSDASPV